MRLSCRFGRQRLGTMLSNLPGDTSRGVGSLAQADQKTGKTRRGDEPVKLIPLVLRQSRARAAVYLSWRTPPQTGDDGGPHLPFLLGTPMSSALCTAALSWHASGQASCVLSPWDPVSKSRLCAGFSGDWDQPPTMPLPHRDGWRAPDR